MAKKIGLILGPIVFLILYNYPGTILSEAADEVLSIAAWMIIWWITEAVSISVTALIPLTFFPLLGIGDMKSVAASYGSPIVFLFFGGFVMALALEKVNLHRRIALNIIKLTGTSPNRVVLGFMIATASLSMWISNTATTVVMLPIAMSVIHLLIDDSDGFTENDRNFALSLMLAIAFSANVGGIATIIGTPPNVVMVGFMEQTYNADISFLKWMMIGLPFSCFMIFIIYQLLVKIIFPNKLQLIEEGEKLIESELEKLGPINRVERQVLMIFLCTMLLWIFRVYIDAAIPFIKLSDAGISMLAAMALFSIPFKMNLLQFILEWEDTSRLPWGILILFGGGLALATGLSNAGVIDMIGSAIASQPNLSALLVGVILVTVVLFMTELMSNVALVAIMAPMIAGVALGLDQEVLHMLIPATMASSCAFMLPMATPPNAIVFASGFVKVHEMAKAGVFLNVISIIILIVMMKWLIPLVF